MTPPTNSQADRPGDEGWQAWLYVADELSLEDRAAFEERLLDNVTLCEAVAQAVELSDLMAAAAQSADFSRVPSLAAATAVVSPAQDAPSVEVRTSGERVSLWPKRFAWMSLGAAACLAVVLCGRAWQSRDLEDATSTDSGEFVTVVDDDARALAEVWTDLWNMEDALSPAKMDEDALEGEPSSLAIAKPGDADAMPPNWLLAAVADQGDGEGESPVSQPQPN